MKLRIPNNFKIGATKAHVSYARYIHDDEGFDGSFNRRTGELQIEDNLEPNKRDKVFGHELMEVIKENYTLHTSEEDMSCIAHGWLEFLEQLGVELDWSSISLRAD